ncbi:hypothetical protein [Ferrithrix thermotolerans]|uniref:hypothetical protein n=1 Tax=Ferrithrix thermotolerans TaxID=209649 RepID=UPI000A073EF0|nr:hypothetical protein [Ferrithrix thermotolerans]
MGSGRAGCGGSRTSGSEGGPEKPTNGNVGRALWFDPTSPTLALTRQEDGYNTTSMATEAEAKIPSIGSANS